MNLYIVTDNRKIHTSFASLKKSRRHTVRFLSPPELSRTSNLISGPSLLYLDAAAYTEKKLFSLVTFLSSSALTVGVIDARGIIADVAELFYRGARDYLGPSLVKQGISPKRLIRFTAASLPGAKKDVSPKAGNAASAPSVPLAKKWEDLTPGTEYRFHMLFLELDGYQNINQRVSETAVDTLLDHFQAAVSHILKPAKGRLWIWNDFGGIALFPLSVKMTSVVQVCMRLLLSRRLISVDQKELKLLLSYRMVLFQGTTVYRERGKTGRIISDSVNTLSHIGLKFAAPGHFYITEDFYRKLPHEIKKCFTDAGTHECTALYRMKRPARY
ncbi:MAG TPA: hypothetical protein ENN69_00885 [Spirochaetia bacterium]|nr:hypothetical protein [Spirochaetia bacterium]